MTNKDINEASEVSKPQEDILNYWFGKGQTSKEIRSEKSALWWKKDHKIHKDIFNQFNGLL